MNVLNVYTMDYRLNIEYKKGNNARCSSSSFAMRKQSKYKQLPYHRYTKLVKIEVRIAGVIAT